MKYFALNTVIAALILSLIALKSDASEMMDFSNATILPLNKNERTQTTLQILQEEIQKRTGIDLKIQKNRPQKDEAVIVLALEQDAALAPYLTASLHALPPTQKEGFKIIVRKKPQKLVLIAGHDHRGLLYGVGYVLCKAELRPNRIDIPDDMAVSSSPRYPLRGHQLGYRAKTNSYDAWSAAQFDQYIRELALFGANAIEIMPPRTDDDRASSHMKTSPEEMMIRQSRICRKYGLDVWMWYPNMGRNYTHPDSIARELQERERIFSLLPKLDALFVPGGDPGDLEPDVLFAWLAKVAEVLQHHHPQAKIWVSPQVFRPTPEWFDVFFAHVNKEYSWFGGVVFGPWVKMPIQEIRRIVKPSIPIRRYPDITHSLSSQYPIPRWDLAFAITLGRECINPRPTQEKAIHNALDEYAIGSLSYSEGTNDDVNKFVWTRQDWDPETPVIETLRDYARFFIGPDFTEFIAQGLMALERNIEGPLLTNDGVQRTLQQWRRMEALASPAVLQNFRFQMGLIRACFDAYVQQRLIYESELERQARDVLTQAETPGGDEAIRQARAILSRASKNPVRPDLRKKCIDLADSLYSSIGAQLTVKKHHAKPGRGNFIDNIDIPLNDSVWLLSALDYIEKLPEQERLAAIGNILHRTDPGPGGFYDDFGSPRSWARVQRNRSWEEDPGTLQSPRVGFSVGLRGKEWGHEVTAKGFEGGATPLAWMHQATTLYDTPLVITYDNLAPDVSYRLRIAYTGRFRAKMKLVANDHFIIHDFIRTGIKPVYEFDIPAEAIVDGILKLTWTCSQGERGSQVSEIWLIPQN